MATVVIAASGNYTGAGLIKWAESTSKTGGGDGAVSGGGGGDGYTAVSYITIVITTY